MGDTSFSSDYSVGSNSPTRKGSPSTRLSTSFNSHPSRSESGSSSSSPSSRLSSSPCSSSNGEQGDGEELEKILGIKPKVACEVCGKKVVNMKAHVKRIHGEGRPGCTVTCGQCDRTVLLSGLGQHFLDNHLETERSISPPPPLSDEEIQLSISSSPHPKKRQKNDLDLPPSTSNQPSPQISCSSRIPSSSLAEEELNTPVGNVFLRTYDNRKCKILPSLDLNQNFEEGEKGSVSEQGGGDEHGNSGIPEGIEKQRDHIQFWIKSNDRDLKGEEVRTMRIKMAPGKTIRRVKKSYIDKLGLDKNKQGELQFMVRGRKCEDQELVGQLDNETLVAEGLWFNIV